MDFNCEVIGEPKPDIKWFYNGRELQSEGRYLIYDKECLHNLEITDVLPEDAGQYLVEAENVYGKATCTAELQVVGKYMRNTGLVSTLCQSIILWHKRQ